MKAKIMSLFQVKYFFGKLSMLFCTATYNIKENHT